MMYRSMLPCLQKEKQNTILKTRNLVFDSTLPLVISSLLKVSNGSDPVRNLRYRVLSCFPSWLPR